MAGEPVRKLVGWKEIAEYLGTSPRTAQRWEREKALPVRRVPGSNGNLVFADSQALDGWLASGGPGNVAGVGLHLVPPQAGTREQLDSASGARPILRRRPYLRAVALVALAIIVISGAGLLRARSVRRGTDAAFRAQKSVMPAISSINAIQPQADQVILIKGRGLGSHTYYANVDTPFIAIRDKTAHWAAGRIIPENWDEVTLNVAQWTDSEIVVTGFAGAYGQHWWKLNSGDQIEVAVWNPQTKAGPATYELCVASPQLAQK